MNKPALVIMAAGMGSRYGGLKQIYNAFYPLYIQQSSHLIRPEILITEDSNAGFEAFQKLAEGSRCVCVSAGGKSRIAPLLTEYTDRNVMVVADGAAFGSEMHNVYSYYRSNAEKTTLYLPECFEWLVLKSGIITFKMIESYLKRPWQHILSEEYKSWELFFTDLLIRNTAGTKLKYSKLKLAKGYLSAGNMKKIRKAIEQQEAEEKKK